MCTGHIGHEVVDTALQRDKYLFICLIMYMTRPLQSSQRLLISDLHLKQSGNAPFVPDTELGRVFGSHYLCTKNNAG